MAASPTPGLSEHDSFRAGLWPSAPLERGRLAVLFLLALLTVSAWVLTIYQARTMEMPMGIVARGGAGEAMAGMPGMAASGMAGMAETWSWGGFAAFVVSWSVMMAAMMFPAASPMVLLFHRASSRRRAHGDAFVPTWVFAGGYLLVWIAVGVLTWAAVAAGSELVGRLDAADRVTWGPLALGGTLAMAGLYQLTPLKRVCLDHCRSPIGFVMKHWRERYYGALRMGVIHGAYCLGCCWALFAVLVAAGVMSLAWMALLTLVVFIEKVLPVGARAGRVIGAALLVIGGVVATGMIEMPWVA